MTTKHLLPAESIQVILVRIFRLLSPQERKGSILILLSIFANSVVEILGLTVVVPIIGLVVKPETIQTNPLLNNVYNTLAPLGINNPSRFLIALCLLMVGAFLFKSVFGLTVNLFQNRFSFSVAHRMSGQMWTHHFSKSLESMRSADTGRIIAEINGWPLNFANIFLVGGLMVLTEVCVIALIGIGLLVYNPVVFISIAGLLTCGGIIIRRATKRRLSAYSDIRRQVEPNTNTLITNAIRGFLEVITFNASNAVRDAYLKERLTIFRISSNANVLLQSPAKLYEVLAVICVTGSIIIALLQDTAQADFLQLLSLMAISAYRIMPSMSRLNGAIMQMRGQKHVLEIMEKGTRHSTVQSHEKGPSDYIYNKTIDIKLSDVTLSYKTLNQPVIEGLGHTFKAGKLHGIVGPSGSGKSTLINSLLGLHKAEKGSIQLAFNEKPSIKLGEDIDLQNWILNIGYLSQQPFLFKGTVRDNLTLKVPGTIINEPLVESLIKQLKLEECLSFSPLNFELHEGGSNLSGGQQQRLALLRALQIQRPVLILDEATSALDHKLRDVVLGLLRQRANDGCNVILVTHDTELAERCDDVLDLGENSQPLTT